MKIDKIDLIRTILGYINLIWGGAIIGQSMVGLLDPAFMILGLINVAVGLYILVDWKAKNETED